MYEGIEYRGFEQTIVEELAEYAGVPVWNGLTTDFHPTQMLADVLTAYEYFGYYKGLKWVFVKCLCVRQRVLSKSLLHPPCLGASDLEPRS